MFGMLERLGGSLWSAQAHLTGEFTPLSRAFTSLAGVGPPLSSHGRVPDPSAALKKPMKTNEPCMWPGGRPTFRKEEPAYASPVITRGNEASACKLWPLNFCPLIGLICSPGAK